MNLSLVAVNARYSHTNPAIRLIRDAVARKGHFGALFEFTINQPVRETADRLILAGGNLLAFSAYLWNIRYIRDVVLTLRAANPRLFVMLGGPEAENHAEALLRDHTADLVVTGEGEAALPGLLAAIESGASFGSVAGVAYLEKDGAFVQTAEAPRADLDALPLCYRDGEDLQNRIVYYESSRGCPYRCSYCLSSNDRELRYRSTPLVKEDLSKLIRQGARQVKFVDRTFNADRGRAMELWRFLREHDNGFTNFHFEMSGELFDEAMFAFLKDLRPGMFQFEIGVQSSHRPTLEAIRRPFDESRLTQNMHRLSSFHNIHLHLDLIAGLPYEDYETFEKSFDYVFSLRPQMIQLGFLKVLAGSPMGTEAKGLGILCPELPPYEVAATRWLTARDLVRLRAVERAVGVYYNSGRFLAALSAALPLFPSPFVLFEALAPCLDDGLPHSDEELFLFLFEAALARGGDESLLISCCRFDVAAKNRPKRFPAFADRPYPKEEILSLLPLFFDGAPERLRKEFYFDLFENASGKRFLVRFDYSARDIDGRASIAAYPLTE